jgi:hypothetical protein
MSHRGDDAAAGRVPIARVLRTDPEVFAMSSIRPGPRAPRSLPVLTSALLCAVTFSPMPAAAAGGMTFGYAENSSGGHERLQYALIQRGRNTTCSVDGSNSWRTIGRLQDEVERTGREVMWIALDDREYVIRDSALIGRAREIVEPMSRLGAEQGRLGSMQGELGRKQGEMGALQGEVAQLQAHLALLEARDDDRHRAELDELHQQLREISQQVRALSAGQRELGEQQRELGRRQRELGDQQRRASLLAFDQLRGLATKAIASGKAEAIASD